MTQKASDLCKAADVAGDLGIETDEAVRRTVSAASRLISTYCNRTFEKATVTEYPRGYTSPYLRVARPPVVSITSVSEFGTTVDAAEYESVGDNSEAGLILRKTLYGSWYSTAREDGLITTAPAFVSGESGTNGYTVVYVGGYVTPGQYALDKTTYPTVTLPEDISEACIQLACMLYRKRGVDPDLAQEKLGDWFVTYRPRSASVGAFPSTIEAALQPYKLPGPLGF